MASSLSIFERIDAAKGGDWCGGGDEPKSLLMQVKCRCDNVVVKEVWIMPLVVGVISVHTHTQADSGENGNRQRPRTVGCKAQCSSPLVVKCK